MFTKNILRTFKQYPLESYKSFAEEIVKNMLNKPEYAAEQPQVNLVNAALGPYLVAYTAAEIGGTQAKNIRAEKQKLLTEELEKLAKTLETMTNKEISWFQGTGFALRRKPEGNEIPIGKAVIEELHRGVQSGTVDGSVQAFPVSVRQIAVEYSSDSGKTWQKGTYSTGRRFLLTGLPVQVKVLVRVCFMGTRQRMGDWSDSREIFVL